MSIEVTELAQCSGSSLWCNSNWRHIPSANHPNCCPPTKEEARCSMLDGYKAGTQPEQVSLYGGKNCLEKDSMKIIDPYIHKCNSFSDFTSDIVELYQEN